MKNNRKVENTGLSRRDFLKGMGGGALGTAVLPGLGLSQMVKTDAGDIPVYERKMIRFSVNGAPVKIAVEPRDTLLEIMREQLHLTGAKKVCDRGECGGCTVLIDGVPVYACTYLAVRADRKKITTIEGLMLQNQLHPVQQAFIDKDGYQCGFCTPGIILTSVAFLSQNSDPSATEIKEALSGHVCRCGNYQRIHQSVATAAEKIGRS